MAKELMRSRRLDAMTSHEAEMAMERIRARVDLDYDSAKDDADELVVEILSRCGYALAAAAYDRIKSLKPAE